MSFSPLFGFGDGGLSAGIGLSATYRNGDYQLSLGAGAGNSYKSLSLSVSGKKWGFGYTYTYYPASNFYGNNIGSQTVGTISVSHDNWNFNFGNDFLAASGDKWRSTAAELIIGDFSIGTLVGTNDGKGDSNELYHSSDDSIAGLYEAWNIGNVYIAPAWIGYTYGNQITRIGFSYPAIQDVTQNVLHKWMAKLHLGTAKYYLGYDYFNYGFFSYRGAYNPFTLWNH